jgi:hypothetical protein
VHEAALELPDRSTAGGRAPASGWTVTQGDCNDCDPSINPNAFEFANGVDDDCNGTIDDPHLACDDGLAIASPSPEDGARTLGICRVAPSPKEWGLVSAKWTLPDGAPPPTLNDSFELGHGLLPDFGPNALAQEGSTLLALSSGVARRPTDPDSWPFGGFDKAFNVNPPMGFPKELVACPGVHQGSPRDGVGLELTLRVPANAHGVSFDSNIFSYDWPTNICDAYTDWVLAMLLPWPAGQHDGNVLFEPNGDPIGPSSSLLQACACISPPCTIGPFSYDCPLGPAPLLETGYEGHASTSWLRTTVPVVPGDTIQLRLTVYDSGDAFYGTTAIFDNFRWLSEPVAGASTVPVKPPR